MDIRAQQLVGSFDIETDTTVNGLDPAVAAVTTIAVATATDAFVLSALTERTLLLEFASWVADCPPGTVVSWGGDRFDIPFLLSRAQLNDVTFGWLVRPSGPVCKYEPVAGHAGAYDVVFDSNHRHFDIEPLFAQVATRRGVDWKLKPMSSSFGMDPVEVDRERIHLLTPAERDRYAASDARVTFDLAVLAASDNV